MTRIGANGLGLAGNMPTPMPCHGQRKIISAQLGRRPERRFRTGPLGHHCEEHWTGDAMVIGPRIRPQWESWDDLPGWLQAATYWACLNGGPIDTSDVKRVEVGIRMGAGAREIFFREEPRWMVKTLLLLKKAKIINEMFSAPDAHKAVAIWWSSKSPHFTSVVTSAMVRKLCCGDMSLGKKGSWPWAVERASTEGRKTRELIHADLSWFDLEHDYTSVILERFKSDQVSPLPNGKGSVIRIPGSYWVVVKQILVNSANQRFLAYWLMDATTVPGKELQSPLLDRILLRDPLNVWIYKKETIPELSPDAMNWFASLTPVQSETGQN